MVVAQWVEWLLLKPEVRSSNIIIGKYFYQTCLLLAVEKIKIKKDPYVNIPLDLFGD